MRHRHCVFTLLAALLALTACGKAAENKGDAAPVERVATVNGKVISKSEFDLYLANVARQAGREVPADQRAQMLDQFIGMHLAADEAEKTGVTKDAEVQAQVANARLNVVVEAALKKYLEQHPVGDEELKPEYDAQVAAMPREYHTRHILVDDKAVAEQITRDIKGGADFAKVAAKRSKDPSGKDGGDLGWLQQEGMVKPFFDAVSAMQPGQLTEQPVQSEFGWHVIKLEETRAPAAPAFEEVKDRVKVLVQRKKLQAHLDELRKAAKIEKT
jgi:peptidyl-prolyl cis-trans isomerase C